MKDKREEKEFLFIDESNPAFTPKNVFKPPVSQNKSLESKEKSISSEVLDLAKPIAKKLGLDIWDVCFSKENSEWYLRIFIEKPDGVCIEDCETLSQAIELPLDDLNIIKQNYYLEVSSPGLERELTKPEQFAHSLGSQVQIYMIKPDEKGKRKVKGVLVSFDKDNITLKKGKKFLEIEKKDIDCIKLDDFNL